MRSVAILTHSVDEYVPDLVAQAIEARGATCTRIDTDRFPRAVTLTTTSGGRALWCDGDDEIDLTRLDAVWCRRVSTGGDDARCTAQCETALDGVLATLACVVNRRGAERDAENKVAQLARARRVLGADNALRVPPTLITSDPSEVRAFAREESALVAKLLVPLSSTFDASAPFVYTSPVEAADLDDIESVRAAPMIFQRRIDKVLDVRAVVVGDRVIAGSAAVLPGVLDWRTARAKLRWRLHELPADVSRACVDVVRSLDLGFACVDLVVDERAAHWFLEVNPAGEWGFLARDAKLPIADALAALLMDPR